MTPENTQKIRDLCGDNRELADAILDVVEDDSRQHKAGLARLQSEGLQRAREKGIHLGRPRIRKPRNFSKIYRAYKDGEISARLASQKLDVSPGTFKRWADAEEKAAGVGATEQTEEGHGCKV